jgi:hypothetical protein
VCTLGSDTSVPTPVRLPYGPWLILYWLSHISRGFVEANGGPGGTSTTGRRWAGNIGHKVRSGITGPSGYRTGPRAARFKQLLQGFAGPHAPQEIIARFEGLAFIAPDRKGHIEAAEERNVCQRAGLPIGTIDVLLARLCMRPGLTLLTLDQDFTHVAAHCALKIWR